MDPGVSEAPKAGGYNYQVQARPNQICGTVPQLQASERLALRGLPHYDLSMPFGTESLMERSAFLRKTDMLGAELFGG